MLRCLVALSTITVAVCLALPNVTPCDQSGTTNNGEHYIFTNCTALALPMIPRRNAVIEVFDSTVVKLTFAVDNSVPTSNITMRFTRCTVLTGISFGTITVTFKIVFHMCTVTLDSKLGILFYAMEPGRLSNVSIAMIETEFNIFGDTDGSRMASFCLLGVEIHTARLDNITVLIQRSNVSLRSMMVQQPDAYTAQNETALILLAIRKYQNDGSPFAITVSNIQLQVIDSALSIQGPGTAAIARIEGLILVGCALHLERSNVSLVTKGPLLASEVRRAGVAFNLDSSLCWSCDVTVRGTTLRHTFTAGPVAPLSGGGRLATLKSGFVTIAMNDSDIDKSVQLLLPHLPNRSVVIVDSQLYANCTGGQFPMLSADVKVAFVLISSFSTRLRVAVDGSILSSNVELSCPYRRVTLPGVVTQGLALSVLVSLILVATPLTELNLSVTSCFAENDYPNFLDCGSFDSSSLLVPLGQPFVSRFVTTATISLVVIVELQQLAQASAPVFGALAGILSGMLPSSPPQVSALSISVVGSRVAGCDASCVASSTAGNASVSLTSSHVFFAGGQLQGVTVDIASLPKYVQPLLVLSNSVMRDVRVAVTGSKTAQEATSVVFFVNATCSTAGCGATSLTMADLPLLDVVSRGSGGGLVALLNGSDALLSGVAWRFSDIHVRARRRRSVSFVLFDANVATVVDPLVDVSLSCVSWNGVRAVPLVGPPLARMYQDSAVPDACVFPAAPTFSQTFVAPVARSVTKAVSLSGAISVVSYAVVAVSGAGSMAALQQSVSQHASMRRMCAAELSSGDQGDTPLLMSSYIDNPLQVRIASFGPEMEYVGGSIVGNLCFAVLLLVVKLLVSALLCALESGTSFDPSALLRGLLSRRFGLPGVAWAPYCAVCQSMVAASVASLASLHSVAGLLLLSVVVLALTLATLVFLFAMPLTMRSIPVVAAPRRSLSPKGKLHALEWMFAPRWQWRAVGVEARHHNGRTLPRAPEGSVGFCFMDSYEELLSVYCRGRHWFFAVEAAVSIVSGVVNGLSMGLRPDVVCGAQWAFSAALLLLLACLLVAVVVLQPYNVRADAVVAVGSALLSAASIVVLMVSAAGDRVADVVGAILMMQSLLGLLCVVSLAHRILASALQLKLSDAKRNSVTSLDRWSRNHIDVSIVRTDAPSCKTALQTLVTLICDKRKHM